MKQTNNPTDSDILPHIVLTRQTNNHVDLDNIIFRLMAFPSRPVLTLTRQTNNPADQNNIIIKLMTFPSN